MASKRSRIPSQDSSSSSTSSLTAPTSKVSRTDRTAATSTHPLLCTLPPTCNHKPTPIANSKDLEIHYAKYHAHVCEQKGCHCVFPDARLLELHQTECHDPFAAIRQERGEKIFACHLTTCKKSFLTPKMRRLHLVQAHGYPKEYFFSVTNKGVGGLLKKWGDGASMVRGEWKKREDTQGGMKVHQEDEDSQTDEVADTDGYVATTEDDSEIQDDVREVEDSVSSNGDVDHGRHISSNAPSLARSAPRQDAAMDTLADSMTALSLVPPSVRFGRGGASNIGVTKRPVQQDESVANRASANILHQEAVRGGVVSRPARGRRGVVGGRGFIGPGRGGPPFSPPRVASNMDIDEHNSSPESVRAVPAGGNGGFPGRGQRGGIIHINRGFVPRARGGGRGGRGHQRGHGV